MRLPGSTVPGKRGRRRTNRCRCSARLWEAANRKTVCAAAQTSIEGRDVCATQPWLQPLAASLLFEDQRWLANSKTRQRPQRRPRTVSTGHPLGFWFFFWGEFAERCSFYGMKTILPVYLTGVLLFADTRGGAIMNWFKMGCYLLPLLGGYLADRLFGKYWTIVGFSIPYVLGHFILGIPTKWRWRSRSCSWPGAAASSSPTSRH